MIPACDEFLLLGFECLEFFLLLCGIVAGWGLKSGTGEVNGSRESVLVNSAARFSTFAFPVRRKFDGFRLLQ
jgi:hypothetical protein